MKDKFPGHYKPNAAKFLELWRKAVFVFDANVLLDLHRYSQHTAEMMLSVMERLDGRVWISHQAALEYHDNLPSVIIQQEAAYADAAQKIEAIITSLKHERAHPYVDDTTLSQFADACDALQQNLAGKRKSIATLLSDNPLKERLAVIFAGRVGDAFSADRMNSVRAEGSERYQKKIPPGFADAKKPDGDKRFGDLVLWLQLLTEAADKPCPYVFVTSDRKEDWFRIIGGRSVGPRPELMAEFGSVNPNGFYIYETSNFLEHAPRHLEVSVEAAVLSEVREQPPWSRPDDPFVLIDAIDVSGIGKVIPVPYEEGFQDFLDLVYLKVLAGRVGTYSYGRQWSLENASTGSILNKVSTPDSRDTKSVGIAPGTVLKLRLTANGRDVL